MNTKDINFINEYVFSVDIQDPKIDYKEGQFYEYKVIDDSLAIGKEKEVSIAYILLNRNEVISHLSSFKDRNFLRLEKVIGTTYTFSLLMFFAKKTFEKEDPFEIVIDSSSILALKKAKRNNPDPTKFFREELLLDDKYCFAFGDDINKEKINLVGKTIIAQVEKSSQNYLHVVDIKPKGNILDSYVSLVDGVVDIVSDAGEVKQIRKTFDDKYKSLINDNNEELLKYWESYNKLELTAEMQKASAMGFLKYKGFSYNNGNIEFFIDGIVHTDFVSEDVSYVAIPEERFDKKNPLGYSKLEKSRTSGIVDRGCVGKNILRISSTLDDVGVDFPKEGYLVPNIYGAITQADRRDWARSKILKGLNPMHGLKVLLQFGESVGVKPIEHKAITEDLRMSFFGKKGNFNEQQKRAIDIAINTPDIALIQGPPGTGKTQVIKAIVERLEHLYNGELKILLSSTQHDAVDNAIVDMYYNGMPPRRIQNSKQREDNTPIYDWIEKIINKCDKWLDVNKKENKFAVFYNIINKLYNLDVADFSEQITNIYSAALK